LAKRIALALVIIPALLFIQRDQSVASGHVRGFWANLFYEVGPSGRSMLVAGLAGLLCFLVARYAVLFASDRLAVRSTADGLIMRSAFFRRNLRWSEIRAIEIEARTARGRSFKWIAARTFRGGTEQKVRVVTKLLDAQPGDIDSFLETAQGMLRDSRKQSPSRPDGTSGARLGRRLSQHRDVQSEEAA
jgi:hypothetical protein